MYQSSFLKHQPASRGFRCSFEKSLSIYTIIAGWLARATSADLIIHAEHGLRTGPPPFDVRKFINIICIPKKSQDDPAVIPSSSDVSVLRQPGFVMPVERLVLMFCLAARSASKEWRPWLDGVQHLPEAQRFLHMPLDPPVSPVAVSSTAHAANLEQCSFIPPGSPARLAWSRTSCGARLWFGGEALPRAFNP